MKIVNLILVIVACGIFYICFNDKQNIFLVDEKIMPKQLEREVHNLIYFIKNEINNCNCSQEQYAKSVRLNSKTLNNLLLTENIDNAQLFNEISTRVNYKK